jgi:hypothetical protein
MDDWCRFHLFKGNDGKLISNHTLRNCREFDQMATDYMIRLKRYSRAPAQPTPAPVPQPNAAPALMAPPQPPMQQPPQPAPGANIAGAIQPVHRVEDDQYPQPHGRCT